MHGLEDRVAIVTGGASGLGEATVRLFHEEGARVVIADVAEDLGTALADELGDGVIFRRCDVSTERDVEAVVRQTTSEFGRLDVMFNNAGVSDLPGSIMFFTRIYWGAVPEEHQERMRRFFSERTAATNPLHRMGEPIEVARVALWLASEESSYVTAEDLVVDGGSIRGVRRSNTWMGKLDRGESILD